MKAGASERDALEILEADVRAVRDATLAAEAARATDIASAHPAHRRSAANLVHYLELRHHDVRDLQARLAAAGLSSLGRSEAHVLATIEEVLSVLARLNGHEPPPRAAGVALTEGHDFLATNAKELLGAAAGTRATRIMVTSFRANRSTASTSACSACSPSRASPSIPGSHSDARDPAAHSFSVARWSDRPPSRG